MHKTSPREIKQENTRFVSFLLYKSLIYTKKLGDVPYILSSNYHSISLCCINEHFNYTTQNSCLLVKTDYFQHCFDKKCLWTKHEHYNIIKNLVIMISGHYYRYFSLINYILLLLPYKRPPSTN